MLVYVTNLGNVMTPVEGAYNQLWATTNEKGNLVNGEIYVPIGVLGIHDKVSK